MKNYRTIYGDAHIIYYPSYGRGRGMKWYSSIIFSVSLVLLIYSIVNVEKFLIMMASFFLAFTLLLWIVADRVMYTEIYVDLNGAKIRNGRIKKEMQFLWKDVKSIQLSVVRGVKYLYFSFHDEAMKTYGITIVSVNEKELFRFVPLERMTDAHRFMLEI